MAHNTKIAGKVVKFCLVPGETARLKIHFEPDSEYRIQNCAAFIPSAADDNELQEGYFLAFEKYLILEIPESVSVLNAKAAFCAMPAHIELVLSKEGNDKIEIYSDKSLKNKDSSQPSPPPPLTLKELWIS